MVVNVKEDSTKKITIIGKSHTRFENKQVCFIPLINYFMEQI